MFSFPQIGQFTGRVSVMSAATRELPVGLHMSPVLFICCSEDKNNAHVEKES